MYIGIGKLYEPKQSRNTILITLNDPCLRMTHHKFEFRIVHGQVLFAFMNS